MLVWFWARVLLSLLCPQTVHAHNPSSHQSHNTHMIVTSSSSSSSTTPHRVVNQQGYDGMMSKGGQYQPGMPLSVVPSGGPGQYQGNIPQGTLVWKKKRKKSATINTQNIYPVCNGTCWCFCLQVTQLLGSHTLALASPWSCLHLGISPSTTSIPPTAQAISRPSPPQTHSTTGTRAWSIATRLSWPTPTHDHRALAACCRLKARRAQMVFTNRYLSVCRPFCLSCLAGQLSVPLLQLSWRSVCMEIG